MSSVIVNMTGLSLDISKQFSSEMTTEGMTVGVIGGLFYLVVSRAVALEKKPDLVQFSFPFLTSFAGELISRVFFFPSSTWSRVPLYTVITSVFCYILGVCLRPEGPMRQLKENSFFLRQIFHLSPGVMVGIGSVGLVKLLNEFLSARVFDVVLSSYAIPLGILQAAINFIFQVKLGMIREGVLVQASTVALSTLFQFSVISLSKLDAIPAYSSLSWMVLTAAAVNMSVLIIQRNVDVSSILPNYVVGEPTHKIGHSLNY